MATDTQQLLLLTSTRNRCRTHRCNHSNERPLVLACPDRRGETRNDSQRNCQCSDTRLELRIFRSTCISLSGHVVADHLVRAERKLILPQSFRAVHNIGEIIASHRIAHIRNVCTLHGHTLFCAPRDRITLAPLPCCHCVAFSWAHCHRSGHLCVLWVLTGPTRVMTHPGRMVSHRSASSCLRVLCGGCCCRD